MLGLNPTMKFNKLNDIYKSAVDHNDALHEKMCNDIASNFLQDVSDKLVAFTNDISSKHNVGGIEFKINIGYPYEADTLKIIESTLIDNSIIYKIEERMGNRMIDENPHKLLVVKL